MEPQINSSAPYAPPAPAAVKAKKPLLKRWWFWLIAVFTVIFLSFGALVLTARADGFKDEEQKQAVWEAYRCLAYSNVDAGFEGTSIALEILSNDIPADEIKEAKRWVDKLSNAGDMKTVGDVIERTDTPIARDQCTGWLWERHQKQPGFWKGYDEFTLDKAVEAGVVAKK